MKRRLEADIDSTLFHSVFIIDIYTVIASHADPVTRHLLRCTCWRLHRKIPRSLPLSLELHDFLDSLCDAPLSFIREFTQQKYLYKDGPNTFPRFLYAFGQQYDPKTLLSQFPFFPFLDKHVQAYYFTGSINRVGFEKAKEFEFCYPRLEGYCDHDYSIDFHWLEVTFGVIVKAGGVGDSEPVEAIIGRLSEFLLHMGALSRDNDEVKIVSREAAVRYLVLALATVPGGRAIMNALCTMQDESPWTREVVRESKFLEDDSQS